MSNDGLTTFVRDEPSRHPEALHPTLRAVVDVAALIPIPGAEHGAPFLVGVDRAPEGATVEIHSASISVSRAGAYRVSVKAAEHCASYSFVAIHPEHLEVLGLGANPRLTLRSLANHPEALSDERWDECHESEHANPFYGVVLTNFGGERVVPNPNDSNASPPVRAIARALPHYQGR